MDEFNNSVPAAEPEKKTATARSEVYDWLQCIVSALLVCVLVFVFLARLIGVVGSSMVPTLIGTTTDESGNTVVGDRVFISNLFYTPKDGDIVVLRQRTLMEEAIVKRVIATEGQTVDIDFENGVVYVDGEALTEPYINETTRTALDFEGPVTVPENCVFVMGDNRNHSTDSRDDRVGMVDRRNILGRVLLRVYPFSKIGTVH